MSSQQVQDIIRKVGSRWRLYSKRGRNLGTFRTRSAAERHERQVEYFKHRHRDCGCSSNPRLIADAVTRRDPTGTGDIRARMMADLRRRWQRLAADVRRMLTEQNALAPSYGVLDPVRDFQAWIDGQLGRVVLGGNGEWMTPYLVEASARGRARAAALAGWNGAPPRARNERVVSTTAIAELQGVMEVVSQRAVRAVGDGLLRKARGREIAKLISAAIRKIGVVRSRALVNYAVVRAYNSAALDTMEDLDVRLVDVQPEHYARQRVADADEELVEVLTAGDDLVCQECEDISQDGPYEIDEARGLIPAHPNCRCAFVPADDARFAKIEREED